MEIITAMMVLGAFLMICTSGILGVWLLSDKPLVSVTVQVAPVVSMPTPKVVFKAGQVFQ